MHLARDARTLRAAPELGLLVALRSSRGRLLVQGCGSSRRWRIIMPSAAPDGKSGHRPSTEDLLLPMQRQHDRAGLGHGDGSSDRLTSLSKQTQ